VVDAVDVDGLRVAYRQVGDGPTVVLLHGYVGDGAATWHPQLRALANEFRLVAWDAPGAGASADPPESFGMDGYADCLAGFVAALGLAGSHLVGLSFGGALALAVAARHPGLARSLVVVSGYAGWTGSLPPDVVERRLSQAVELSELTSDALVDALLPTMFATMPTAEDLDRFAASMRMFHPSGFRAMARASAEDLRSLLPSIDSPTLLVYGDQDVRAPLPVAEHLHTAIAGAELTVLPGVGHVCNLERPDTINDIVRAWLHRHR
jgi:pimeloyl-ACP methyl ester carboxylesterase